MPRSTKTKRNKPKQTRAAAHAKGRRNRKTGRGDRHRATSKRQVARPAETARKSKQAATGRAAAPRQTTVFSAQLAIDVVDGTTRDRANVHLAARAPARNGQTTRRHVTLADREKAARRIGRASQPERIAAILAALSHPQRIAILAKLLETEATHRLLSKHTGLKAGPLYHHLRELRAAGLIGPKVRDLYVITRQGRRAILAALAVERVCRSA